MGGIERRRMMRGREKVERKRPWERGEWDSIE
jgi:hypothetical protein